MEPDLILSHLYVSGHSVFIGSIWAVARALDPLHSNKQALQPTLTPPINHIRAIKKLS